MSLYEEIVSDIPFKVLEIRWFLSWNIPEKSWNLVFHFPWEHCIQRNIRRRIHISCKLRPKVKIRTQNKKMNFILFFSGSCLRSN